MFMLPVNADKATMLIEEMLLFFNDTYKLKPVS